jgi:hypothetical protein
VKEREKHKVIPRNLILILHGKFLSLEEEEEGDKFSNLQEEGEEEQVEVHWWNQEV